MAAPVAVPGFTRKESANPFNYTEDQLGEKKLALKTMMELYPGVPYTHAEWVYDLCKNTSQEKLDKMMKKIDLEPSRYVAKAGESYTLDVVDASMSLIHNQKISSDSIINDESSAQ